MDRGIETTTFYYVMESVEDDVYRDWHCTKYRYRTQCSRNHVGAQSTELRANKSSIHIRSRSRVERNANKNILIGR